MDDVRIYDRALSAPEVKALYESYDPLLQSNTYAIPSDVIVSGGGDMAQSTNYSLWDSIGEPIIGLSSTENFTMNAGYRQSDDLIPSLGLSCEGTAILGNILFRGTIETDVSCVILAEHTGGYQLSWHVQSGSGGTATGSLISQSNETIAPYSPAVAGTPESWTLDPSAAAWGGRLLSASTDTDAMWGVDAISEKWLNVGTGSFVIVRRTSDTDPSGSFQQIGLRAEVGSSAITPTGLYQTTITVTVSSL